MKKKRIVLSVSVFLGLLLLGCTIASYKIYDMNLIPVSTFYHKTSTDGNLWTMANYLPETSITTNSLGQNVVYRLQNRMGWFAKEYYVEEVPFEFYYENGEKVYRKDGSVRVNAPSLEEGDQLVEEVQPGLMDGLTVKWVYGERGQYMAAVWY